MVLRHNISFIQLGRVQGEQVHPQQCNNQCLVSIMSSSCNFIAHEYSSSTELQTLSDLVFVTFRRETRS